MDKKTNEMENYFIKKRSDSQYTDIENFNQYEFRSCIAYELAIRNIEIQKLIKEFFRIYIDKDIPSKKFFLDIKYAGELYKTLTDDYYFRGSFYLNYHFFSDLYNEIIELISKHDKDSIELNKLSKKTKLTYEEKMFIQKPIRIKLLNSLFFKKKLYCCKETIEDKDDTGTNVYTVLENHTKLYEEYLYHRKYDNDKEELTKYLINPNYSRPQLISFNNSKVRNIEINFNLPKNEIIGFITELVNELAENNHNFMSVNDLFFRNIKKETTDFNYRAKTIADMLYIYDYVTYILDDVKKYNASLEKQLLDTNLDKYDKLEIKKNLSPYTTAKSIITSEEYGNTLSKQLKNKSKKTIEDYYNTIYNLIQNNSYKTLI